MVSIGDIMDLSVTYVENLVSKEKRIDGRKHDEFRKITIETGVIEKAEGSARVKIGETEVLAGVKMGIGEPFPDKPDEGILMVGAELSPSSSPEFETGPPSEDAIELARVVDRGIRESHAIDVGKLVITSKEKVWMIFADIHIINHDGNLLDAAGLAVMSALSTANIPAYDGEKIDYEKKTDKLPVKSKAIPVTFAKIGDKLLIDPSLEEEGAMSARLTITTNDNGNINAMQKGGNSGLSEEEINKAIELSIKKGNEIRKLV